MKYLTRYWLAGLPVLSNSVAAETYVDSFQFHHHKPMLEVSEYKKTNGKINVHIVPHSHDDVGWLKTVEEYFAGVKNDIQDTNVRVELTSIMNALEENPERKFSEVEMKFFSMWWEEQTPEMKKRVKKFVDNG
jgi:alpha-mannosidase